MKRELNAFESPDLPAIQQKIAEGKSRLRGLKIEGEAAKGHYISNRPRSEIARFLTRLAMTCQASGLELIGHRGLKPGEQRLEELIIREIKCRGTYGNLVRYIQALKALPYRVLVLETGIRESSHPAAPNLLEMTLVLSL
jgi:hypothetical protein